jgi:hypothetical protein
MKKSIFGTVSEYAANIAALAGIAGVLVLIFFSLVQKIPYCVEWLGPQAGWWALKIMVACFAITVILWLIAGLLGSVHRAVTGQQKKMTSEEAETAARRCIFFAGVGSMLAVLSVVAAPYFSENALFLSLLARVSMTPISAWAVFFGGCLVVALMMLLCAVVYSYISDAREEKNKAG